MTGYLQPRDDFRFHVHDFTLIPRGPYEISAEALRMTFSALLSQLTLSGIMGQSLSDTKPADDHNNTDKETASAYYI